MSQTRSLSADRRQMPLLSKLEWVAVISDEGAARDDCINRCVDAVPPRSPWPQKLQSHFGVPMPKSARHAQWRLFVH